MSTNDSWKHISVISTVRFLSDLFICQSLHWSCGPGNAPCTTPTLVPQQSVHYKLLFYTVIILTFILFLVCLLKCSGHGHCDPITKRCICYQLWMENLIQRYLNDGESNCGEFGWHCVVCSKNDFPFLCVAVL